MKSRVLIIDDSPFVRRIIKDWLSADPEFEVAGVAEDGQAGVEMAAALKPDLITLDVEMPRMNGIQALAVIMKETPCPVVMVSSVTRQGAVQTLEALELGAVDFVTKPDGPSSIRLVHAKDELLSKCRIAVRARRVSRTSPLSSFRRAAQEPSHAPHSSGIPDRPRIVPKLEQPQRPAVHIASPSDRVVLVASSTGGPRALTTFFSRLPQGFSAPILVVQHMPSGFTDSFARRLDQLGPVPVKEAQDGDKIVPGTALLAPGGWHMEVANGGVVKLSSRPPLHGVRPAADYLFHSACSHYGAKCIAAVLTGMGKDGADGALAIRRAGGTVFGESEESCVIYGMPRAAKEAGAVNEELDLADIPAAIAKRLGDRRHDAA